MEGGSALYYAVSAGDLPMVRSLVEAGADVNVETRSRPLRRALAYNFPHLVSYLASRGARL